MVKKAFENPVSGSKSVAKEDMVVKRVASGTVKKLLSTSEPLSGASATLIVAAAMSIVLPFSINSVASGYVSERLQLVLEPALLLCVLHGLCAVAATAGAFGHVLQQKPLVSGYLIACLPVCAWMGFEGVRLMMSDRLGKSSRSGHRSFTIHTFLLPFTKFKFSRTVGELENSAPLFNARCATPRKLAWGIRVVWSHLDGNSPRIPQRHYALPPRRLMTWRCRPDSCSCCQSATLFRYLRNQRPLYSTSRNSRSAHFTARTSQRDRSFTITPSSLAGFQRLQM